MKKFYKKILNVCRFEYGIYWFRTTGILVAYNGYTGRVRFIVLTITAYGGTYGLNTLYPSPYSISSFWILIQSIQTVRVQCTAKDVQTVNTQTK